MERFYGLVATVADGLRTGSLSPEVARQKVREAGFESFVRVAEKRDEAIEAFTDFYAEGYYVWQVDHSDSVPEIRFCLRTEMT